MQDQVVAEARAQLKAADTAQSLMSKGHGRDSVEGPLWEAFRRWQRLPVSDLMKAPMSGCAELANNTLGIAQEARQGRGDGPLAAKRRQFIQEDRALCLEALKNPRAAFISATEMYPHVVVE